MTRSGIRAGGPNLPTTCTFIESVPMPPENHLVLYTGRCPAKFRFPEDNFVEEDGSINMATIGTYPGGDFNASSRA